MNTLTRIKLVALVRLLLLAGFLWTQHSSAQAAADNAPNLSNSGASPAGLQESAKTDLDADHGQPPDKNWSNELGKKAFPLAVIFVVFAWLGFSAWCDYRKTSNLLRLHHQERMAALEKGLELPPYPTACSDEQQLAASASDKPGRTLLIGLVWLFLGIGLAVALAAVKGPNTSPAFAAVPAGIGLAYLIYHFVEGRKSR